MNGARYLTPEEQAFAVWLLDRAPLVLHVMARALAHWPVPNDKAKQQERRDLNYAQAWLRDHAAKDDEG